MSAMPKKWEPLRKWAKDAVNGKSSKIPYIDIVSLIDENAELRVTLESRHGVAVPAGYALVPLKPTDEMVVAFAEQWYAKRQAIDDPDMAEAYADMLAVAPQPPAVKEAEPLRPAPARTSSDLAYESMSPERRKKLDADMVKLDQQIQDRSRSRERRQHVVPVDVEKRLADRRGAKD